ncbi:MAG: flagellar M-ring protein FliF [Rhodobacteraceae bacterium]|nr:flagellar M-ring protein FliF [Paracoccaceae bacterium]
MFQANYWRAKEGELARTIVSSAGVKSARVHIAASSRGPFQGDDAKPTASVTVTTRGGALNENVALGIRYMVALSVAGLEPSQVAVIDSRNGVILAPGDEQVGVMADAVAERRSAALRSDLAELLAVRVGPGNVQVSVTVETSKQSETVLERLVDPDSQVTVSSDTQNSNERSKGSNSAVTVASNLPDGEAANADGQDESEAQENRETVAYRYSETERSQVLEAGEVKRIGVAVLLNHLAELDANGDPVFTPRPAEELAAIEELVKSAMAFDADRGDTVTIRTMEFAAPLAQGSEVESSVVDRFVEDNFGSLIQMIILALVVLALGLFVVRPILAGKAAEASEETTLATVAAGADGAPVLLGPDGEPLAAILGPDGQPIAIPGMEQTAATLAPPEPPTKEEMEEADRARIQALSDLIMSRTEESASLLKKWLSDGAPPREAA